MCSFSLCFSAELLVLIAAIFLLVYVTKQQVNKWFTYGSVAIIIVTLIMMICSICCAVCMKHCSQGGMQDCGYNQNCSPEMMMYKNGHCGGMGMNHCSQMMMQGESCEGMAGCEEMEEGGECCESHGGEKTHKTIIIEKDTVVKKK